MLKKNASMRHAIRDLAVGAPALVGGELSGMIKRAVTDGEAARSFVPPVLPFM